MNNTNLQIQEAQQTPNWINLRRSIPKYIIVKLMKTKDKERILKEQEENNSLGKWDPQ